MSVSDAKSMLMDIQKYSDNVTEDIAIIGMACRFPMADNTKEFWNNLVNGVESIRAFPDIRRKDTDCRLKKNAEEHDDPYQHQGYLNRIDEFDAAFFNITPKEATLMDPAHRIMLETVWEALEDAGIAGKNIIGSDTGVFIGKAHLGEPLYKDFMNELDPVAFTGMISSTISGRISYLFDLKSINMVIDTACSSSLVAVHNACKALQNKECKMAIVGGVSLSLFPSEDNRIEMMESPDYKLKPFDKEANGTVWGEGIGVLILKPIKKAIEDKDNIYAVIKGSASNSDGTSNGMTAPNAIAQENLLITAWERAGVTPETIQYIETHGTGTSLGDPIEIKGISNAFKRTTSKKQFCGIGSVKANIGHLIGASGIASLIKVVLCLKHQVIPPTINFDMPNSFINFIDSPVYINDTLRKWERSEYPRRAGVSSFGLSGTNCHVVVEEYLDENVRDDCENDFPLVFTLAAKNQEALYEMIKRYNLFITENININVRNICYTVNTGRSHFEHRLAFVVRSKSDFLNKIKILKDLELKSGNHEGFYYNAHKILMEHKANSIDKGMTSEEIKRFSNMANKKLSEFVQTGRTNLMLLEEVCSLYVDGADVEWELLFKDMSVKKISLPFYPFSKKRYWVANSKKNNIEEVLENEIYFGLKWKEELLDQTSLDLVDKVTVIFKAKQGYGDRICSILRSERSNVIEVEFGEMFSKVEEKKYVIRNSETDFKHLFDDIGKERIHQIIHLLSVDDKSIIDDVEDLKQKVNRNFYNLFYLCKTIKNSNTIAEPIDFVLVTLCADSVIEDENVISENAVMYGLIKGISREYPLLKFRYIDVDESSLENDDLIKEFNAKNQLYNVAYRQNKRYVQEFVAIDIEKEKGNNVQIKNEGVYVITGGLGGIGLEIAKFIASKNNVKLVLINRSKLPDRKLWSHINESKDEKLYKVIKAIEAIESNGSEVIIYSADVSDMDSMTSIVSEIKDKYGGINGIIHSAGVSGQGFILEKKEEEINTIFDSKIYGTWVLDKVTEECNMDFFVLFSSIATVFTAPGQADYAAANCYMDSFAVNRNRRGKKTCVIDWVAWKDTGMAAKNKVNIDTMFKAIKTETAIKAFDCILHKDIERVIVGEMNYGSKMLNFIDGHFLKISEQIKLRIDAGKKIKSNNTNLTVEAKEVLNAGRDYKETEKIIKQVFMDVLGFEDINVNDNFFELGADSILLSQVYNELKKIYSGSINITDIFENYTISKLAAYINESLNPKNEAAPKEKDIEAEISAALSKMESGELSVDNVVEILKKV
ncbi:type I polyketide synthase [Acetivibrio clariflavus]|uniref:type I polyketide synthase n=1 Tax=Acetivibrio clariflavus TaxID=288965 RepID=UPI00119B892C|nr:SDR family NAD(P)-dependent oxidoreductase [Acetivibrio clariflavus]